MLQVQNYELKCLSLGEHTEMSGREKVREQTGGWISCGKKELVYLMEVCFMKMKVGKEVIVLKF